MTDLTARNDTTLIDLAYHIGVAEKSRDVGFFRSLLAERFTFRRASTTVVDKTTYLNDLLNPENTYDMLESQDVSATILDGLLS